VRPAGWGVALLLLAAGLLVGCGVRTPGPEAEGMAAQAAYEARAQRLAGLQAWTLEGRVTVKGPQESGQVRVRLQRDPGGSVLDVRNVFGQTMLRLTRDGQGLRLRDDRGQVYRGPAARRVLRARLGWRVPVGRLDQWVLGLARPGGGPAAMDGRGRPLRIESGPWRIRYPHYVQVEGVWLPQEVNVGHDGLDVRIRVDDWRLQWPEAADQGAAA